MPYEREVNEAYITWCEGTFSYPCGVKWCSKKIFGIKIWYLCGLDWCTAAYYYPCIKHRIVKKICYTCSYVRMKCWGFWCNSYCCEGGREYGSWTGAAFMMFGEKYNWAGGSFCFDDPLGDQGKCKTPVDPQDSRPPDDPRTYPPGDGGTVTGPGGARDSNIRRESIGLGDVIKAITSAVGIKPCIGCRKRAEQLNRLLSVKVDKKQ